MSVLQSVFHEAATLTAATGLVYAGAIAAVAGSSVLSRNPQRRRDARATLAILMRRDDQR
ncbi:hypothetical protein [Streptomyces sp. NPDC059564]|uniref:hypothetical protein n=1 Tax=Streptomyces sp. NPDC059564 TaxID=3346865 RepID=UPI00369DD87E